MLPPVGWAYECFPVPDIEQISSGNADGCILNTRVWLLVKIIPHDKS